MDKEIGIASYCLNCPNPRCKAFCPCSNDIPAISALVKRAKFDDAAAVLAKTNPFPELTSLLCDHARQCRGHCIRGIRGEPVDYPAVEFALASHVHAQYKKGRPNGKRVAIIGAGPSALSASIFLIQAGFAVKIFEKENGIGGAIRTGIPAFRFDKGALDAIQERLTGLGVEFEFGRSLPKEEILLLKEDFDFVLLAIGAEKANALGAPECPAISQALPLLAQYNENPESFDYGKGKHIVVMGGGNVAMDISRTLIRVGAKVTLIYRRDEASMPAQRLEIEEAKDDGVAFSPLTNVADYLFDEGQFKGLRLVQMRLGEKDESGRPSFHVIEGSEFDFPCDGFVMAIGEKSALPSIFGEEELGIEQRILPIGDCKYGAKNIAAAIADGRDTAAKIIETLD